MASESKSRKVERETEKISKASEKALKRQAKEFSNNIDDVSDSLKDFSSRAHDMMKQLNDTADPKMQRKLLRDITKIQSDFEKQEEALRSGLKNFGDYMTDKNKDITQSLMDSAEQTLKSIESLSSSMSDSVEQNARKTNAFYQQNQNDMLKRYEAALNKQNRLVASQEKDLQKYYSTTNRFVRDSIAKRMAARSEELDGISRTADRLRGKIDDVDTSLVQLADTIEDTMSDISSNILDITEEMGDRLEMSFSEVMSDICGEVREAMASLELDAIFQGMGEDIDSFVENRRQTLSRVNDSFDVDAYSKSISGIVDDLASYSRSESSEFVSNFIKDTRMQNINEANQYMTEIAAQMKAYGSSLSDVEHLMWQDNNSGANGEMFKTVSNIAGSLEDNDKLYTSADNILSALNDKAELMYGLAQGDSKKQTKMLESVAAIQALQDSAANAGVSDLAEGLAQWSTMSLPEIMRDKDLRNYIGTIGMSAESFYTQLHSGPEGIEDILNRTKSVIDGLGDFQINSLRESGTLGVFSNDASVKALQSMNRDDFQGYLSEVSKSIADGEGLETSIAADKENKATGWLEEWKNDFMNNPLFNGISDFFGEMDIGLANAAHAVTVASNIGSLVSKFKGWSTTISSTLSTHFPRLASGLSSLGTTITSGLGKLGGVFSSGLSKLGGLLSKAGGFVSSGIGKLGTMIGSSGIGSTLASAGSSMMSGTALQSGGAALTSTAALGVIGAIMTIKDAVGGVKKSKEWLGEEKGSSLSGKVSSGIGGALGGTGPGVGQGSFGDTAKNVLGNTAKYAAVGGAIGSIIPGVGTAIGAGVGAIAGAVTGVLGGERISKAIKGTWDTVTNLGSKAFTFVADKMDKGVTNFSEFTADKGPLMRSLGNVVQNSWDNIKETGQEIKEIWSDPDKGFFSKVGGTLKSAISLPFKQIGGLVSGIKDGFSSWVSDTSEKMDKGVTNFAEFTSDKGPMLRSMGNIASKQWEMLKNTGTEIKNIWSDPNKGFLGKLGSTLKTVVSTPFKSLGNVVSGIKDGFSPFFAELSEGLAGLFGKFKEKFAEVKEDYEEYKEEGGKFGVVGYGASKAWEGVKSVGSKIAGAFGFDKGLSEVPNDGWAYIHKGEAVLTKDQAINARADGGIPIGNMFGSLKNFDLKTLIGNVGNTIKETIQSRGANIMSGQFQEDHPILTKLGKAFLATNPLTSPFYLALKASGMTKKITEGLRGGIQTLKEKAIETFKLNEPVTELQEEYYTEEEKQRRFDKRYQKTMLRGFTGSSIGSGGFFSRLFGLGGGSSSSGGGGYSGTGGSVSGGAVAAMSSSVGGSNATTLSSSPSSLAGFVADMTSQHEGKADSINHNDNGAVSIGKMQWHADNAKNLLNEIRAANQSQFDSIISQYGAQELASSLASGDSWKNHIVQKGSAEDKAIQALLSTEESKKIQEKKKVDFAQSYIDRGKEFGIKDEKALAYLADMYNQYGLYHDTINNKIIPLALQNGGDLDAVYNATLATTNKYLDRRGSIYQSLKGANFSGLSSSGGGNGDVAEVPHSDDWIKIAMSQKGYKEEANNDTPFGKWIGAPNQPWCASFVSWSLAQAGVSGLKSAAVSGLMSQAQSMGVYQDKNSGYIPGYGDVFFNKSNGASHTGFVISSTPSGSFTTIEGNAGDMVKSVSRSITDASLTGFAALGNKGSMDTSAIEASTADGMSTYAQGTPWVPDTQVALLHPGEAVVPAEYNPFNSMNNTSELPTVASPNYDSLGSSGNDDVVESIQWGVRSIAEKLDRLIAVCGSQRPRTQMNPNSNTRAVYAST